jgi:glycosyltransferase involved in cell wall biosynthesis
MRRVRYSVVVSVYNQEAVLPELHDRPRPVLKGLADPAEIIFVDNGSTDRSPAVLKTLHAAEEFSKQMKSRPLFVVDERTGFDES